MTTLETRWTDKKDPRFDNLQMGGQSLREIIKNGDKVRRRINCVKLIRNYIDGGLVEAKNYVDKWWDAWVNLIESVDPISKDVQQEIYEEINAISKHARKLRSLLENNDMVMQIGIFSRDTIEEALDSISRIVDSRVEQ